MNEISVTLPDGLGEKQAAAVQAQFQPMLDRMTALEEEFNLIADEASNMTDKVARKAKALRLKYVKIRTDTAKIHKVQKATALLVGRFVDGWKNAQLLASSGKEEKLKAIEEFYNRREEIRIAAIHEERAMELRVQGVEQIPADLGTMEDAVWSAFITGVVDQARLRKEAEEKAEADAKAAKAAEAAEKETLRKEKAEADAKAALAEKQAETAQKEAEAVKEKERQRVAREEQQAAALKQKQKKDAARIADQDHRRNVEDTIRLFFEEHGFSEGNAADVILTYLCAGKVPHVSITY